MGYLRNPDLLTLVNGKGTVTGVSVCNDEIFITRDNSPNIETLCGSKFKRGRCIAVSEKPKSIRIKVFMSKTSETSEKQTGLQDVTCDRNVYLFASEWNGYKIFCICLNARHVISSWQMEAGKPSALSITKDGKVLVSCTSECKICEYTSNGDLAHEISFHCNRN